MNIDDKLTKIIDKQDEMNETLIRQEGSLKEHMRRTALLEKEVRPVVKHVAMMRGAGILLAITATALGVYKRLL